MQVRESPEFMRAKHLILPLALLALLFSACDKANNQQANEPYDQHPTWTDDSTNNFWDKQPSNGFTIDTAWDGDTTINF